MIHALWIMRITLNREEPANAGFLHREERRLVTVTGSSQMRVSARHAAASGPSVTTCTTPAEHRAAAHRVHSDSAQPEQDRRGVRTHPWLLLRRRLLSTASLEGPRAQTRTRHDLTRSDRDLHLNFEGPVNPVPDEPAWPPLHAADLPHQVRRAPIAAKSITSARTSGTADGHDLLLFVPAAENLYCETGRPRDNYTSRIASKPIGAPLDDYRAETRCQRLSSPDLLTGVVSVIERRQGAIERVNRDC